MASILRYLRAYDGSELSLTQEDSQISFIIDSDFVNLPTQEQVSDEELDSILKTMMANLEQCEELALKYHDVSEILEGINPDEMIPELSGIIRLGDGSADKFFGVQFIYDDIDNAIRFLYCYEISLDEYLDAVKTNTQFKNNGPFTERNDKRDEDNDAGDEDNRTLPSAGSDSDSE
jgi:hypothetical protein|tara:strand:- start:1008 stop:1535 length:528 start_codon:yes stop_codon:yes gene_type:complete